MTAAADRGGEGPVKQTSNPLAGFAPYARAGDLVFFSGIVPVDGERKLVISGYDDLPEDAREAAGMTGMLSLDLKQGPVAAQSWWIFHEIEGHLHRLGGSLSDVVHLTQFLVDVDDFPVYDRVRASFFDEVPASTLVGVSELMPSAVVRVEVQAIAHLPA